jgi:hypothetical protein
MSLHSHLRRKHNQNRRQQYQPRRMETDPVTRPHLLILLYRLKRRHLCAHLHHHTLVLHPLSLTILDMMIINLMGTGCPCLDRAAHHEGLGLNAEGIDPMTIEDRLDIIDT